MDSSTPGEEKVSPSSDKGKSLVDSSGTNAVLPSTLPSTSSSKDNSPIDPKTPSPKSKVTIEFGDSPTNNIGVNKRSPHSDSETRGPSHRDISSSSTYIGVETLFKSPPSKNTSTSPPKDNEPKTSPSSSKEFASPPKYKSPEGQQEAKIFYPDSHAFIHYPSAKHSGYEKTTYKTSLSIPLDTTFTIPAIDNRNSLVLSTLDLLVRFDNHSQRSEYAKTILRQAKEDAERKIEELGWKVKCFAEEELIHRKDMRLLEGKFKDVQVKLTSAEGENKGLRERLEKEEFENQGLGGRVEELENELGGGKDQLGVFEDENRALRERMDNLEQLNEEGNFYKGFGEAEEEIAKLREKMEELQGEFSSLQGQLGGAEDENVGLKDKIEELESELSSLRAQFDDAEQARGMSGDQLDQQQEELANFRDHLNDANDENARLHKDIAILEKELQHMRELVGQGKDELALKERIKTLQQENARLQKANDALALEIHGLRSKAEKLVKFAESFDIRQTLGDLGPSAANKQMGSQGVGQKTSKIELMH
ncbi:hypothetical protein EG329_014064 [Mollisiaceae sp. DMI_Dod_QoI]|nr:hypothetical protein EG329_014064 [Helotiales sp. DMI_Dod_QoI]